MGHCQHTGPNWVIVGYGLRGLQYAAPLVMEDFRVSMPIGSPCVYRVTNHPNCTLTTCAELLSAFVPLILNMLLNKKTTGGNHTAASLIANEAMN